MGATTPALSKYGVTRRSSDEPAVDAIAITPDDSNDLANVPRAIRIGIGGTLRVITVAGATLDLTVYDGEVLAWACIARVKSTGTTATGMHALV
jgi:hypothetical protein